MALSHDGTKLATFNSSRNVDLLDTSTGALLNTFDVYANDPSCLAFAPDDNSLAVGSFTGEITIIDISKKRISWAFSNPGNGAVRDLLFSPDGKSLITTSLDKVILLDTFMYYLIEEVHLEAPYPTDLAFSSNGTYMAAAGLKGAILWDMASGKVPSVVETAPEPSADDLAKWSTSSPHTPLSFTPDGRLLFKAACNHVDQSPCQDTEIRSWSLSTHAEATTFTVPSNDRFYLDFSPDGSRLVGIYCRQFSNYICLVSQFSLWDTATGKMLTSFDIPGYANGAVFAPGGQTVIAVMEKQLVFVDLSWIK